MGRSERHAMATFWLWVGLIGLSVYCLFPLGWMLSTSLKPFADTYRLPPIWIPEHPTVQSYVDIWQILSFTRYFLNSSIVAGATTILAVLFAGLAGYGFSRFRFRGSGLLLMFTLITQMFPGIMLVIPYFQLTNAVGLFNSYPALIIAYTSFALPFSMWMLKGFFDDIPTELDEAAMIDGCSRVQAFLRVVLPLSLPGVVGTAIFSFLLAWNEFLFALALTSSQSMYVVTVGIASNIGQFRIQWNDLMAGAIVATLPTILLYSFLQRYLVEGLTSGAVKG